MSRGLDIICGCFSTDSGAKSNIVSLLIRDIILLVLLAVLLFQKTYRFSLDAMLQKKGEKKQTPVNTNDSHK
jgi:hypothetical protein